jgi:hypothetical protein
MGSTFSNNNYQDSSSDNNENITCSFNDENSSSSSSSSNSNNNSNSSSNSRSNSSSNSSSEEDTPNVDYDKQIITSYHDRIVNIKNYLFKIYTGKNEKNEINKPTIKEIKNEILDKYYKETDLFNDITICKKILDGKNCRIILYFYYDMKTHLDELHELCNCCKNKKHIYIIIEKFCKAIEELENNFKISIENTKEVKEILEIGNYERRKKRKK